MNHVHHVSNVVHGPAPIKGSAPYPARRHAIVFLAINAVLPYSLAVISVLVYVVKIALMNFAKNAA
jgi:hypothetical protein